MGALPAGLTISSASGSHRGKHRRDQWDADGERYRKLHASGSEDGGQTATKSPSIVVAPGSSPSQTIFFHEAFEDNSLLSRGERESAGAARRERTSGAITNSTLVCTYGVCYA